VERLALEAAVVVLAVEREQLGKAEVGGLLDAAVQLDERDAQASREAAADGRLAGAAQAEQGHRPLLSLVGLSQESGAGSSEALWPLPPAAGPRCCPRPDSSCTRKRADKPDRSETSRSVHPRSSRSARVRRPSASSRSPAIGALYYTSQQQQRTILP
jgi:hypothetical protein